MILFTILVVLAAAFVGLMAIGFIFKTFDHKAFKTLAFVVGVLVVLLAIISVFFWDEADTQKRNIEVMYEDLIIYNDTVQFCEDENVRFAHYERVKEYNDNYDRLVKFQKNKWIGFFVPKGWDEEVEPIKFQLFGASVGGIE
jgi:energy-coupling factor transporter transmembrane protein EcfT